MNPLRLTTALGLVLASFAVPAAAAGADPAPQHACLTGASDFDGNGGTDAVVTSVGKPRLHDVTVEMRDADGPRAVTIAAPGEDGGAVYDFGRAIADVDLSPHDGAAPCAALAISGIIAPGNPNEFPGRGIVYLYEWSAEADNFELVNRITSTMIDPGAVSNGGSNFGWSLAAPTAAGARPAPRQPVLYVGGIFRHGAGYEVGRVTLDTDGTIVTHSVIVPKKKATDRMPLTSDRDGDNFGSSLLGTPDPNQVIIGAPHARPASGGRGAVVVWNRVGKSQLFTEPGVGLSPGQAKDGFGSTLWLSSSAAYASHQRAALFIGAPGRTVAGKSGAGAAVQLRYQRIKQVPRVLKSSALIWRQNSKGVAGTPTENNRFGSSFQSLSISSGAPSYIVGVPGWRSADDVGKIVELGDGSVFTVDSIGAEHAHSPTGFGTSLSSWRNVDDYLAVDPFPAPDATHWSQDLLAGAPQEPMVVWGLPADDVSTVQELTPPTPDWYGWGSKMSPAA